jgi:hypothetical protein
MIIISLGINPVRGGRPPSDRINIIIADILHLFICDAVDKCLDDIIFDLLNIEKSGTINEQYTIKYNIDINGLSIINRLMIHPVWVIDE